MIPTWFVIICVVVLLISCGKGCGSSSSNSSYSGNGYSDQYNYDNTYRKNIDDSAKAWGKSSREVDTMIQNVGRAMSD